MLKCQVMLLGLYEGEVERFIYLFIFFLILLLLNYLKLLCLLDYVTKGIRSEALQ